MVPMSRLDPMASVPDMPMPGPVPVSGRPHVATAMRGNVFDAHRWRRGTDDDDVCRGESRRRRAQAEEHAKRQGPERITYSAIGLVARSRRRPDGACCVTAHARCSFFHESLLFHDWYRWPEMTMEKGPERNYRCRARHYSRCFSGRTISTQFNNAPPAPLALCGLPHLEKYFWGAGEVVLTATTPEWRSYCCTPRATRHRDLHRAASGRERIDNDRLVAPNAGIRSVVRGARVPNGLSPRRADDSASANILAPTGSRPAPPALLRLAGLADQPAQ
jgi:hypothetical protein